jgi:hypothetical protein
MVFVKLWNKCIISLGMTCYSNEAMSCEELKQAHKEHPFKDS